jgi:hypothetical protein
MAVKSLANATSGILWTDRRDFYISPNVTKELWTDAAPFLTIMANRGIEQVGDPDYKMFEHRAGWVDQRFLINASPDSWTASGDPGGTLTADNSVVVDGLVGLGGAAAGDASLVGLEVEIWDTTLATYKGVAVVTAFSSGVKLKALGNPRAATNRMVTLADNDVLIVIGSSFGEGSVSPDAFSDDLSVVYNSCQIYRTPVEITGTLYANTKLRGYSNELARLRKDKNFEHKLQKEKSLLYGVRIGGTGSIDLASDNSGSGTQLDTFAGDQTASPQRTTMGMFPALYRYGASSGAKQNLFSITAASYTYSNFVDDMQKVFRFTPMTGTEKTALVGPGALSYWSKVSATTGIIGKSGFNVQISGSQRDSLGFNFRVLETPHGTMRLVPAPALKDQYVNSMLVIDPNNVSLKQYRPMKYSTNIKTENGYDGVKDEYFSDEGLGITLIESHSLMTIV